MCSRILRVRAWLFHCSHSSSCPSSTVRQEIGAYEIVTPVRVNEAGDKFPTSVHFKRKRRSLDEDTGNATDHWASPNIHYRITAFGQNYHLNLTLDSGFIAPIYTVTILGVPQGDNATDLAKDAGKEEEEEEKEERAEEEEEEDTELRHCFYRGHVNAQAQHAAVISLCSGLVSFYARCELCCASHNEFRPASYPFFFGGLGGYEPSLPMRHYCLYKTWIAAWKKSFQTLRATCLFGTDRAYKHYCRCEDDCRHENKWAERINAVDAQHFDFWTQNADQTLTLAFPTSVGCRRL